jgi:hypothetical protein
VVTCVRMYLLKVGQGEGPAFQGLGKYQSAKFNKPAELAGDAKPHRVGSPNFLLAPTGVATGTCGQLGPEFSTQTFSERERRRRGQIVIMGGQVGIKERRLTRLVCRTVNGRGPDVRLKFFVGDANW